MTEQPVGDNLVGLTEIGQRAGVSKAAVSNWRSRDLSFPQPITVLKAGPIFWWPSVKEWLDATGRQTDAGWTVAQVTQYDKRPGKLTQLRKEGEG